jgi:hypothetical protein
VAGVFGEEVFGSLDVAAGAFADQGFGVSEGVGGFGVGQFGDAQNLEEFVVRETSGRFSGPFAFLQGTKRSGCQAGEAFAEG